MHVLSGIRTHNPSVRASENSSCLRRAATMIGKTECYEYISQNRNVGTQSNLPERLLGRKQYTLVSMYMTIASYTDYTYLVKTDLARELT
jgi:hypothetical protein